VTQLSPEASAPFRKVPTHIDGFDEVLGGGLPAGRATVVVGTTGSGKTMLGMQFLVEGARKDGETGIFVSFEESRGDLGQMMQRLGLAPEGSPTVHIMDAEFLPDAIRSGAFDLNGMLAALSALVTATGATRIVFDAVDVLLELIDDPGAQRNELHRLFQWIRDRELTAVISAKSDGYVDGNPVPNQPLLLYLSHCVVVLSYNLQEGICGRSLRLLKYRGTSHSLNELPMMIGAGGILVYGLRPADMSYKVFDKRVSSGVERLDTMLGGGGFYQGSSILLSGSPGTAKTTLGCAFIDAACARGDNAVLISLDEAPEQIVRNLRSVGMDLGSHVASGKLIMHGYRAGSIETEAFLRRVLSELDSHNATTLVIDPISALTDRTQFRGKNDAAARLLDEAKSRGVTVLFTSLMNKESLEDETSQAAISTIADTWMQLSFKPFGGERNRALTIIKSRGMKHSNQVRELVISEDGLTLADVYTAGGDVLMGTARMEREMNVEAAEMARREEFERRRVDLTLAEQRLSMQRLELEAELEARRAELQILEQSELARQERRQQSSDAVSHVRRADTVMPEAG
jgi:circadian clock protein KaiC